MKNTLAFYFKIWLLMSKNAFLSFLQNRLGVVIFLTGKIIRFTFFFVFIVFLLQKTNTLAGYTLTQTLLFFTTFNLVDVTAQFLYREVYRFRGLIVEGTFDFVLVKPWNPLFRSLFGGADILDLITIPPLIIVLTALAVQTSPGVLQIIFYILLLLNALMIATAFHIIVISLGIITLDVDHTVMIYRDLTNLGKFPVDIYKNPLRGILTFIVPVGIMVTLPAKVLIGLVSPAGVFATLGFGVIFLLASFQIWKYALRRYTSASS